MNLTVSMAYQKVLDAPLKYRLLANLLANLFFFYSGFTFIH